MRPYSRFTKKSYNIIKKMLLDGLSQSEISRKTSVNRITVSRVKHSENYEQYLRVSKSLNRKAYLDKIYQDWKYDRKIKSLLTDDEFQYLLDKVEKTPIHHYQDQPSKEDGKIVITLTPLCLFLLVVLVIILILNGLK